MHILFLPFKLTYLPFFLLRTAAEVLANGHTFVKLKPLADATVESRSKARKCSSSLQPYRPRPETCAALARRLVTTPLGVRLKTAPEERENERRVLREAKGNVFVSVVEFAC